ncbi:hypothetical protein ABCS02_33360 [Microbacterium sp. X-17]|uniref:hypothetical protein n=1 Tax=Microbacterium sp. X-17 TaxID=3144404 RepID=UPI0031F508AC
MTDPTDTLLRDLARQVENNHQETGAIVLLTGSTEDESARALHEATFEALRGIIGALTVELAGRIRINLVRAITVEDATTTLDFLHSPTSASVAGATFDLTGEFE